MPLLCTMHTCRCRERAIEDLLGLELLQHLRLSLVRIAQHQHLSIVRTAQTLELPMQRRLRYGDGDWDGDEDGTQMVGTGMCTQTGDSDRDLCSRLELR